MSLPGELDLKSPLKGFRKTEIETAQKSSYSPSNIMVDCEDIARLDQDDQFSPLRIDKQSPSLMERGRSFKRSAHEREESDDNRFYKTSNLLRTEFDLEEYG